MYIILANNAQLTPREPMGQLAQIGQPTCGTGGRIRSEWKWKVDCVPSVVFCHKQPGCVSNNVVSAIEDIMGEIHVDVMFYIEDGAHQEDVHVGMYLADANSVIQSVVDLVGIAPKSLYVRVKYLQRSIVFQDFHGSPDGWDLTELGKQKLKISSWMEMYGLTHDDSFKTTIVMEYN